MGIIFGDIITISLVERYDGGKVWSTNIEEIAKENGLYHELFHYFPTPICVGHDSLPEGLQAELVGKEVGAKGTVIIPPEKAYGKRSNEKIQSISRKKFDRAPELGETVSVPEYGDGIVVKILGSQLIIDFNHQLAGKEIECEYEIHEIITDPAEQFSRLLDRMVVCEYEASFENGNGIISVTIPPRRMFEWNEQKVDLAQKIFDRHPSLDTFEFREEYDNFYHPMEQGEDDVKNDGTPEAEGIKDEGLLFFNFIERCDGKVLKTSIKQVAIDNDIYDETSKYIPDVYILGIKSDIEVINKEFIGKEAGEKGTVTFPADEAYGKESKNMTYSIDRKEISTDAEIGSSIHHPVYGEGIVVNKFGKRVVVDFSNPHAGKDIEFEYEILEKVIDPTEQFFRLLSHLGPEKYDASFENGKGIINLKVPLLIIHAWGMAKIKLTFDLFINLPSLKTLEFREKYGHDMDEEIYNLFKNEEYIRRRFQELIGPPDS